MGLVIEDGELEDVGKIRGWLLLPALGLVLGIGRGAIECLGLLRSIRAEPAVEAVVGFIFGMVFLSFSVAVAVFFFTKHRWAPWLYIALLAGNVLVIGLSVLLILVAGESIVESATQLTRSVVTAAIWIPYFIKSRRVKLTFVNGWRRGPELSVG